MKIYDATTESMAEQIGMAKDKYWIHKWGPWVDNINWKSLMYDEDKRYTHVQTCNGLYLICKWGPTGELLENAK